MRYEITNDCTGCGVCESACPEGAIFAKGEERYAIEPSMCTGCGKCFMTCLSGAILGIGTGK